MPIGNRKKLIIAALWPFIFLAVMAASIPIWFPLLGTWLVVSEPLEKAGAIVPLGGGDPQRFKVAAQLFKEDWAPRVITTGSLVPDYMEDMPERKTFAQLGAEFVANYGVPPDKIDPINEGTSTFDEAQAVRKFCEENKIKGIIVVTSIFHTRRSRAVYRKVFEGSGIKFIMYAAEGGRFTTDKWWTREDDLVFVNSEWIKFALYLVQGKI